MKATLAIGLVVAFLAVMGYVAVATPQLSPQQVEGA
jgi:hypothetical protein